MGPAARKAAELASLPRSCGAMCRAPGRLWRRPRRLAGLSLAGIPARSSSPGSSPRSPSIAMPRCRLRSTTAGSYRSVRSSRHNPAATTSQLPPRSTGSPTTSIPSTPGPARRGRSCPRSGNRQVSNQVASHHEAAPEREIDGDRGEPHRPIVMIFEACGPGRKAHRIALQQPTLRGMSSPMRLAGQTLCSALRQPSPASSRAEVAVRIAVHPRHEQRSSEGTPRWIHGQCSSRCLLSLP
jgi:hypothetical protein